MKNSIETTRKKLLLLDEYEAVLNSIDHINQQIDDIGQQIGEMTTQSSETWHDNAGFDECQRMMALLSMRKKELQSLINHIHIVEPTMHDNKVSIGSKLMIKVDDQYKEICIWWYQTLPWRVSYASPIGQALIGKTKGVYKLSINEQQKSISIEHIAPFNS